MYRGHKGVQWGMRVQCGKRNACADATLMPLSNPSLLTGMPEQKENREREPIHGRASDVARSSGQELQLQGKRLGSAVQDDSRTEHTGTPASASSLLRDLMKACAAETAA